MISQPGPLGHTVEAAEPANLSGKTSPTRLKDAAHQFEASLMQELMGPLDTKSADIGEGPEGTDTDNDAGSDAVAAFARESMARSLSARGGFGIADSILHYFEKTGKAK